MSDISTPYEDLLQEILDRGHKKEDRTGTGTISLFGKQMRWDLGKSFPLITTKKVAWKAVRGELLWFLRGDTNNNSLKKDNIKIWNEWANNDGSLGAIYGSSWRSWVDKGYSPIVEVEKRQDDYKDYIYPFNTKFYPKKDHKLNTEYMWCIDHIDNDLVEYQTSSGFIGIISNHDWENLSFYSDADFYQPVVCGKGFIGDTDLKSEDAPLYFLWEDMIRSCYDPHHPRYQYFGFKGYTVSPYWLAFSNFKDSISTIYGYAQWSRNIPLHLSPDYYGSMVFSPSTTVFLDYDDSPIIDDSIVEVDGYRFSGYYELAQSKLGYTRETMGKAREIAPRDGYVWRRRRYVDQIQDIIEQIKHNPDSRRLIVSSWNVSELHNMALPPCHLLFQFYVADGKLSCQLYQRSADMFLGVPFNIASYALLTHMIAEQTGLEVGEFIWSGGDCHIYTNHIEQVKEQLSREPRPYPQLHLIRKNNIEDYTIEDATLAGYDPHPAIKAEVSV